MAMRIIVAAGPDAGHAAVVEQLCVVIGRGDRADFRVTDPTVSQFHVEVSLVPDGVYLLDRKSTNGVRVGGVRIERGTVPMSCPVSIGKTVIRIEAAHPLPASQIHVTSFVGLIGQSPPMLELYRQLDRLARTDLSVMILGETGCGKEEVARALHERGPRAKGPFAVLDCAALPASLAHSTLFGHEKGAFTNATERRIGKLEAAHGGTLFIDEIGDLPLELQPTLLRVLERREIQRVGSHLTQPIDVRIICATWKDLYAMVNNGTFREDLFYRLAGSTVRIPPLRERPQDVPLLVQHFLAQLARSKQPIARSIAPDALAELGTRDYRGNVRELKATVERLAKLADGPVISSDDLRFDRMLAVERARNTAMQPDGPDEPPEPQQVAPAPHVPLEPFKDAKRTAIDDFERRYLQRLLERSGRNLSKAAALAGLERHNLRELLRKHGLYPPKE